MSRYFGGVRMCHDTLNAWVRYSAIEHLATICFSRQWKEGRFTVFTVAFDASSAKSSRVESVAGFVSSAADWMHFQEKWNARLAVDSIQYMHMHEYVASTGQFKGWAVEKKRTTGRSLIEDLVKIIREHAHRKFGSVLFSRNLEVISLENRIAFSVGKCIALVGGHAASDVRKWVLRDKLPVLPRLEPIS
jgi:hypothetical protein